MSKEWDERVANALSVVALTKKQLEYNCSHTSDGRVIKLGLKVFALEDPLVQWSISEIDEEVTLKKRTIKLEVKGQEPINRHPTKLFFSQKKAVDASIKDIQNAEKVILREMRESLMRLDAPKKMKMLKELKKQLK